MDIIDGRNKGKTLLAIYELNGDILRVCYDLTGKVRPTEFKTRKSELLFLATYKAGEALNDENHNEAAAVLIVNHQASGQLRVAGRRC